MATFFKTEDGRLINLDNVTHISNRCVSYINNDPGTYEHNISAADVDKIRKHARADGVIAEEMQGFAMTMANNLAAIADVLEAKL